MPVTLGQVPDTLRVVLVVGADFTSSLRRKDGSNWPTGAQLILEFPTADGGTESWQATLSGATAIWDVDQTLVDALIAERPRASRLWYVEGELRMLWAQGDIDVRRS